MAGFADLLQGIRGIATDPLFTAGASIYQGAPVGSAMSQAQNIAAQAEQASMLKRQREQQEKQQQQWQQVAQNAQGVPAQLRQVLPFLNPQQGASVIAQNIPKAVAPRYMKSGNQIVAIGPDGKPKVVHQAPQSPIDEMKMRFLQNLFAGNGQAQPQPPQFQPQSGPAQAPELTPMSAPVPPDADPNFIRTQAMQPGANGSPSMQLTPEQRQALALNLVMPGAGSILQKGAAAADKRDTWQQPSKNQIDEKILNTIEQSSRLADIEKQFRPEFQTVGGGLKALGAKWWEKFRGQGSLDPSTQKYMKEFAAFRQAAISNINSYIKEMTGAQMSEAEAKRLRQGTPDPGEDPFSGDSPSEFQAKLADKHRMMRLAMARYNYLRSGRWSGGVFTGDMSKGAPISLDQMRGVMNKRRNQLLQEAKMRMPNNKDDQQAYMVQKMQQEFGV